MEIYRITRLKYLENFSGRGGSFFHGARWNNAGLPVLYFATSSSLALLEMANYIPNPRLVPADYRLGIYHLPDSILSESLSPSELPDDWSEYPYPQSTQKIGSEWLLSQRSSILFVPSVAVPGGLENIAVINPQHPEIEQLKLVSTETNLYNNRMFDGI